MNPNNPDSRRLRMFGLTAFLSLIWLTIVVPQAIAQQDDTEVDDVVISEDVEVTEEVAGADREWSPGMYLPLDGSSVEAFEGSLEEVQAQSTEAEYATLQNALEYLLVYDLAARRDPELLYERLDGKTPADVIGMVKWRLQREESGP